MSRSSRGRLCWVLLCSRRSVSSDGFLDGDGWLLHKAFRPLGVGVKDGGRAEILRPEVLFAGGCKAQHGAEAKKLPSQVIWGLRREPSTISLGYSCFWVTWRLR